MARLSLTEITEALTGLPQWRLEGNALVRDFSFPSFADAMVFVNRVAQAAEAGDHHPDIDIRYTKVRLALTSHDSGGITKRDVRMARTIDSLS